MISTLFFDVGETILDAEAQMDALAEVHRKVLEDFGFPFTRDEYLQLDKEKIVRSQRDARDYLAFREAGRKSA